MSVLCLIANPADPALDAALVAAIQHETGGEINWLHQRIACDLESPDGPEPVALARAIIGDRPVDAVLIPRAGRRKRLLVADMDSTMVNEECIDELADALGLKDEVAAITERAMNGEIDFEAALRTRVALIKGLELKVVKEIRRERITPAPGGRALIQTMKAHGAFTSLVSGGFTLFADYFAERIGFDEAIANVLDFSGDRLAGTVSSPIVDKNTKLDRLLALAEEKAIAIEATMAVGDGANDLPMLKAAGLGVALHPKLSVASELAAAESGVVIEHGDLTALLYLQGYEEDEIVR